MKYDKSKDSYTRDELLGLDPKTLLEFHNAVTGKDTQRFSSAAEGLEQTMRALQRRGQAMADRFVQSVQQLKKGVSTKSNFNTPEQTLAERAAPSLRRKQKTAMDVENTTPTSKRGWDKAGVRERRSTRMNVTADGREFRSVLAAFKELQLPLKKHIAFRQQLRKAGAAEFQGVRFVIVKATGPGEVALGPVDPKRSGPKEYGADGKAIR